MNAINSTTKTRGSFTIEFALVAVFMSFLIVFTVDMVSKQSIEGMLDRMSYSAVSVIKERTQLYSSDSSVINQSQVQMINRIVSASLKRTLESFEKVRYGAYYEEYRFDGKAQGQYVAFPIGAAGAICRPPMRLTYANALKLSPVTNASRRAPLFQVTLCYKTDNFFGNLVGGDYQWVRSNSIVLGR